VVTGAVLELSLEPDADCAGVVAEESLDGALVLALGCVLVVAGGDDVCCAIAAPAIVKVTANAATANAFIMSLSLVCVDKRTQVFTRA
jgi:hypothetical protein